MTTYSAAARPLVAGRMLEWQTVTAVDNGVWTWFTDPRTVVHGDDLYVGWVNSSGTCGITKRNVKTGVTASFNLSAVGLEIDDHNNTGVHILPDGKILALYGQHNDTSGMRYRISTNPYDISAWSAEVVLSVTTPISYFNPHYLSATGKTYVHYRSGAGGVGTNPMNVRAFDGTTWDAQRTWITQTGERPYIKACNNGVDRIDFLLTNCHPNENAASVYHCYMQLDGSAEKFYKSDGTYIGTSVTPADCTLIYDGTTIDGWVWDITYGADGHPRVLFTRFPTTTDHRYIFSRWTGSAWLTPTEITNAGTHLYSAEQFYSGGITFDGHDPNTVYLSKQVGSFWEIQAWHTNDNGETWSLAQHITQSSSVRNCRPWSPRNHGTWGNVLFWSGTYSTFTNYNTAIKLARLK